ncbi:hypothetical protein DL546_000910 [Coniochaeta pulveracea]|uniref:DUF3669 domain-containing protein n=1 Tax=Coniochaeta pulveracea TaxID=177199 RepID=A0A420YLJ1_9PEZI|nr:hypothetical protein DL546_000910 [Coniochaeta pulveracea]
MEPAHPKVSRRKLATSSEFIADPTPPLWEVDAQTSLKLLALLENSTINDSDPPTSYPTATKDSDLNNDLRRMLSIGSVVSTSSSAAERHNKAQRDGQNDFRKIGAGACGAVFAQDGKSIVVKLAKASDRDLWNDYVMHTRIATELDRFVINGLKVPACYYFVPQEHTEFFDRYPGLMSAANGILNLPTAALLTERILPLPQVVREKLIQKYCPERIRNRAMAETSSEDCLVRPYLGSVKGKSNMMFFSLRNLKLHLNQLLELGLDIEAISTSMGHSLAVMHWSAQTDARDVEFVLGSSSKKTTIAPTSEELETMAPLSYTGPESYVMEDFFCRTTELFLLDFNQVRRITMDDAGITLAVEAFRINDPYYPRPLRTSKEEQLVWKAFVVSYLDASESILQDMDDVTIDVLTLPRKFIQGIIEAERVKISDMGHQH